MKTKIKDLRQKDLTELKGALVLKREELVKMNFDLHLKKVKNVKKRAAIRKEIARILTIIKERQLTKEDFKNK